MCGTNTVTSVQASDYSHNLMLKCKLLRMNPTSVCDNVWFNIPTFAGSSSFVCSIFDIHAFSVTGYTPFFIQRNFHRLLYFEISSDVREQNLCPSDVYFLRFYLSELSVANQCPYVCVFSSFNGNFYYLLLMQYIVYWFLIQQNTLWGSIHWLERIKHDAYFIINTGNMLPCIR